MKQICFNEDAHISMEYISWISNHKCMANKKKLNFHFVCACVFSELAQMDSSYQMMLERQHQLEQMHRQHQLQQSRRSPLSVQGRAVNAISPTQHIKHEMSTRQKQPSHSDEPPMAKRQLRKFPIDWFAFYGRGHRNLWFHQEIDGILMMFFRFEWAKLLHELAG